MASPRKNRGRNPKQGNAGTERRHKEVFYRNLERAVQAWKKRTESRRKKTGVVAQKEGGAGGIEKPIESANWKTPKRRG